MARDLSECKVYNNILEYIGNTPLVKLQRIPKDHGLHCEIYAKCEFLNPGGSIKDRISYTMVNEAERTGIAKAGTRFVEPTSGNTGIGVSLVAAVKGYGCTIVTPDKNSDEKISTMKLLGSDVVQTPSIALFEDPENFMSVAKTILNENSNATSLDQYSNDMNPKTHYEHTAEEILSALGDVDMVVVGSGTGGTVTGVAKKMKEKCPNCIIVTVDPKGSTIFADGKPKLFFVEGIGGDFVPDVLDKTCVDRIEKPDDNEAFNMAREIIKKEGLLCGGSSGAAMVSAVKAIKAMNVGAGKKVVVILPDGIRNYMTKFVCDQWMEAHLFKKPPQHDFAWWNRSVTNLQIDTSVPTINKHKTCADVLSLMGSKHSVAIVVDDNGFYQGALSKDSLRKEATNPKREISFNLRESVYKHMIKTCYKIVENRGSSTIGLASRILDITPFVVVVEEYRNGHEGSLIPKGIITPELILEFIINNQHAV